MRVKNFDVGVESITSWGVGDEVHLPKSNAPAPAFLPQPRALDDILRRPSLDERLPDLLQPATLDASLLEPSALSDVRFELQAMFGSRARIAAGAAKVLFEQAAAMLAEDTVMDDDVRAALATLLRG